MRPESGKGHRQGYTTLTVDVMNAFSAGRIWGFLFVRVEETGHKPRVYQGTCDLGRLSLYKVLKNN